MKITQCQRCSHGWTARVEEPACCPKCKSYDWDKIKGESSPVKNQGDILGGKK